MDLHSFIFDFRYFIKNQSDYRWRFLNKYLQVPFELNYLKIDYKDFNEFCYKIKELKKKDRYYFEPSMFKDDYFNIIKNIK